MIKIMTLIMLSFLAVTTPTQAQQATTETMVAPEQKPAAIAKPEKKAILDCTKFQHEATYQKLITWAKMSIYEIDTLTEYTLDGKCNDIIGYAGAAHCKQPSLDEPRILMREIGNKCQNRFQSIQAAKQATQLAEQQRQQAIKNNRVISAFPKSTYTGNDSSLENQIRQAVLGNRELAKSNDEMLKVQPMGGWQTGNFLDTKLPYRKLTGTVLWRDDDNDGICAYASYNFIQIGSSSGNFSPLKFKSFCMGCPEGWVKCE